MSTTPKLYRPKSEDSLEFWLSKLACDIGDNPASLKFSPAACRNSLLLSVSRRAMSCEFEVLFNQRQYPLATEAAEAVLSLIGQLENLLSVYMSGSELSTLNRFGVLRNISLSSDTRVLLSLALAVHGWTDRAFDITAGSLSDIWGFSRRRGRKPNDEELKAALGRVGSCFLHVDTDRNHARLLKPGVSVNPGGIGKGYALDRSTKRLLDHGIDDFMIHGGMSSVVARGNRDHTKAGGGWLVSLKHPWRWEEHLGTIRLRDQALATSGSGKQFFHFGGKRYSHIIDPRTGWPAQSMMSSTVICPSGAIADALATAFFVMGPKETRAFCEKHPQIAAILVYIDPSNGCRKIETCNTTDDMWQRGACEGL